MPWPTPTNKNVQRGAQKKPKRCQHVDVTWAIGISFMDKTIQKPPFHRETLGMLKSLRGNLGFHDRPLIADYQNIQYPPGAAEMAHWQLERVRSNVLLKLDL